MQYPMSTTATSPPSSDSNSVSSAPPSRSERIRQIGGAVLALIVLLAVAVTSTRQLNSTAQDLIFQLIRTPVPPAPAAATTPAPPASGLAPNELPPSPEMAFGPYFSGALPTGAADSSSLVFQFRELLDLFEKRQSVDDNFTLRVLDNRSGELLELFTLTKERARYRRGHPVDWRKIDRKRRSITRRLVDKYESRDIPREAISVKWGRANQVHEAHASDEPYVEYEMRLARHLGLSRLPTEIGTVETFNQDHLVSPVGARSRYQMMPFILRRNGIHHYRLRTTAHTAVQVREELHPLLTMEPAFLLLRGYVNAVGHEIPGISAYHTGPGNIYKIYRLFLTESENRFTPSSTVMDAYLWAVTEGYDLVKERSTFGPYSRGYVASAYGALQATDRRGIDTTATLRAARVQLKPGATITLRQILDVLDNSTASLDWGFRSSAGRSLYKRFRALNPHFDLPESDSGTVPDRGNIHFVSSIDGKAVQFFLPLGAPNILSRAGFSVIDDAATFRFDSDTYTYNPSERTRWDRAYNALVDDIRRFGFTERNRERLLELYEHFKTLATKHPSPYRRRQLKIIETHRRIWMSNPWEQLAEVATRAIGRQPMPVQPPITLETEMPLSSPNGLQ